MQSHFGLAPRIIEYKLHRTFGRPRTMPISVTISVTNKCNSRCKTCFIWQLYRSRPELRAKEFSTEEFERTFENLGNKIFYVVFSGGEPFLRDDLPKLCEAFYEHCKPSIITIPTNALLPRVIAKQTKSILERVNGPQVGINLSLDGVGAGHDMIRGVAGNFARFLDSYKRLVELKTEFPNLQIGVHSVVSKYNVKRLMDVYEFVKQLNPDVYITEPAEQRTELFTKNRDVRPNLEDYVTFIRKLSKQIGNDYAHSKKPFSRITQAFRLTYYEFVAKQLGKKERMLPCYAGYASCQINPFGDVWPCCILGYDKSMGNLRETDYDFKKVWFSPQADEVRKYVRKGNCACPLANVYYTNALCNLTYLIRVLTKLASFRQR